MDSVSVLALLGLWQLVLKFLIADEPVSALDISVRAQILKSLSDAQKQRSLAILFIAHDLAAVRQVSARIAVMYKRADY